MTIGKKSYTISHSGYSYECPGRLRHEARARKDAWSFVAESVRRPRKTFFIRPKSRIRMDHDSPFVLTPWTHNNRAKSRPGADGEPSVKSGTIFFINLNSIKLIRVTRVRAWISLAEPLSLLRGTLRFAYFAIHWCIRADILL